MYRLFGLALCLLPSLVTAQVFKCVDSEGKTTYAQVPCVGEGQSVSIRTVGADPILPDHGSIPESERMTIVADWFQSMYPTAFVDMEVQDQVVSLRDSLIAEGVRPAEALLTAAKKIAPAYESQAQLRRDVAALEAKEAARQRSRASSIAVSGIKERERLRESEISDRTTDRRRSTSIQLPDPTVIDSTSGTMMAPAAGGVVDPRNGAFYQRVAGGYIDTRTGQFIPSP